MPFVGTVRFDRCFFKGACRKTIIEMAGPPQTGNTIMTDERIDLAQADDEVPGTATPPDLEVSTPVNRSIQNGIVEVWFRIPLYGEHQVWMEFFVNGVPSGDISEKWFLGYQDGFQWQPFISQVPGAAHLKAKWRHGEYFSKYTEIDFWISNQPVITYPAENETITDRRPKIIGTGGGNCSLRVMRSHSADQLSITFTANSNQWAIDLNQRLPYGDYSIAVEQSKSGYTSRHSLNRPFKIRGIDFSSPQPAQLVPSKDIIFRGESNPGVMVHVIRADSTQQMLNRVLPTPVFTAPEVNEEVGCDLLVEGTDGVAGGRVQLWDAQFGGDLGNSDFLTMDGYWSVALKGLAFREYRIQAVQVMGSRESLPSGVHVFKVVVLPPVIEVPAPQGAIARTAIISGTGLPFARVDVFLQGSPEPLLRDLLVNSEGRWRSEPVTLEIGHKTLWARQTFEARPSKDSAHQAFRVVPAAPSIETPVAVGQVGRQTVVSGFGYAGDEVAVAFSDEPQTVLGCVQVRHDRTWSVAVELDRLGGNYSLIAVQSRGEFHSSPSEARPVVLGTYVPSVDVPAPGRWVSDPVGFAGQGQTGKGILVSWYNPERVLAMDIVVTDEGWQRQARLNFSSGGHWVRFKQTIQRDVSDWAESARFEVVSSQSEAKL